MTAEAETETETERAGAPSLARRAEARAAAVRAGDRRALARAVTLVESRRADHRAEAAALIDALAAGRGADAPQALRLGLSGPPGVGKSTLIETLGVRLVARGARVAVLAVDPSSAAGGGSILGDKTRMPELARAPEAFIRPSPAGGALGGVARRTRETIALAEAAGFSVVIVETVGVGQSETMVADMTDVFALLVSPGGGDELQGVKRGVMELADLVLVNKADGAMAPAAAATAADYAAAMRLFRRRRDDPEGYPAALTLSGATGAGVDAAWERIAALDAARRASGARIRRRRDQALKALRVEVERGLLAAFEADPAAQAALAAATRAVAEGARAPEAAAAEVLAALGAGARRNGGGAAGGAGA